jgi:hypothetical protein
MLREKNDWMYRKPLLERGTGYDTSDLCCPECDSEFIHQGEVVVYDRAEDEEVTRVTYVHGGCIISDREESATDDNPSARRHGMAVNFSCEECYARSQLTIAQHKGKTFIGWRWWVPEK